MHLHHGSFQKLSLAVRLHPLLQYGPAFPQAQHGMVRIYLVTLVQKLLFVHHRHLPVFHVQVPVAIGVLEQQHIAVGKNRDISCLVLQQIGLLLFQFLITDNHILHPGILTADPAGP